MLERPSDTLGDA